MLVQVTYGQSSEESHYLFTEAIECTSMHEINNENYMTLCGCVI